MHNIRTLEGVLQLQINPKLLTKINPALSQSQSSHPKALGQWGS